MIGDCELISMSRNVITTVDLLDDGFGFKIEEQSSRGCDVTESGCARVSDAKKLQKR